MHRAPQWRAGASTPVRTVAPPDGSDTQGQPVIEDTRTVRVRSSLPPRIHYSLDEIDMAETAEKVKCVDIQLHGSGPVLAVPIEDVDYWADLLGQAEVGDVFSITVSEYTEAEIEAMDEFQGF